MKYCHGRLSARSVCAIVVSLVPFAGWTQDGDIRVLEAPTVEVVTTTPLPGIGAPINEVPGNIKATTDADIRRTQAINLPSFLEQAAPSVNVNNIQNNPYQPQVNYRGFTASPLLGEAQGLSVYQDGVRVNEPFGDVVNWDLIPQMAISSINVIPGSNPLYGLNTLGGALSIRTKSGRYYPNTELQAYGGSFGRWAVQGEHGGYTDTKDYYLAGNWFEEDGWRDFSPSKVRQFFGKIGHESGGTDLDLSLTVADNDLTGNGVVPESMLRQRREQVFTVPDNTRNEMVMLNLSGSQQLGANQLLSGTTYYRHNRTRTLNGDVNDEFTDPSDPTAVDNRTSTKQDSYGLGLQWALIHERNRFTLGGGWDESRSDFTQSSTLGTFQVNRSVEETGVEELENSLTGKTRTLSLFATDTITLHPKLLLTLSGRFNNTQVKTEDRITLTPPNLDGDFTYNKFNPAVGLNFNPSEALNTYVSWSQGNRAPSPIELGCADPNNPCTLPNALASDPFLKQVVAQTWEIGARGKVNSGLGWSAAVFRTDNKDDILFISSNTTSAGYFTNFGKTRRQGAELGVDGEWRWLRWWANYSYVDATFQSSACLLSANNSSRGTSSCPSPDDILVTAGNRIPGIPKHHFNLLLEVSPNSRLSFGAGLQAFSSQFARGNENNQHQPGTVADGTTFHGAGEVGGYAVLNLTARFAITPRWELFARIDNVLDRDYSTGAILAENPFDAAGAFQTNSLNWAKETFFAPAGPRAGWIGIRYSIERPKR